MAGGLQEVRDRISSVQNTMQITSAMKMVSAAKLRRAQDAITQMRPYAVKLQGILSNVSASLEQGEGTYSEEREAKRILVVAITSNRGLCGAFNNNIVKEATKAVKEAAESGQIVRSCHWGKRHWTLPTDWVGLWQRGLAMRQPPCLTTLILPARQRWRTR